MKKLGTSNSDSAITAMNMDKTGYKIAGKDHKYENKANNYFVNATLKINEFALNFQHWRRDDQYGAWYRDIYEHGHWVPEHTYLNSKYEKRISDKIVISNINSFKISRLPGSLNEDYWYVGYVNGQLGLNDLKSNTMPYWYISYYGMYSEQFRSELKSSIEITQNFNITSGFEYRQNNIQGNFITSAKKDPEENATAPNVPGGNTFFSRDLGFYAQANYLPVNNLSIVLGGRVDNNKIRINGGYGTVFCPKVAIVYTPSDFIFKAIYSEAFKDADYWTKYSTSAVRIANPLLEPERVKNIELNAGMQLTENLFFDITGYIANYSNITNEVAITYTDESGNLVNGMQNKAIGSSTIKGLQTRINFKQQNYSAFLYYSYTDPYSTSNNKDIRIGDIANHKLVGGGDITFFRKLNCNLIFNYIGERPTGANTTVEKNPFTKIDSYFILNGAVTYNFIKGLSIQLSANNLLDLEYFDPGIRNADGDYYAARMPQYRRNFLMKLIYDF
jgi:outer membrane receptor for ferrienterochelin and colicin